MNTNNGLSRSVFRKLRHSLESHVKDHHGVRGSAIGNRYADGELTDQQAFLVLVEKKIPPQKLKSNLLPKEIRIGKNLIRLDVVEVGTLQRQSNCSPKFSLASGSNLGTVSARIKISESVYGLTCAHCLFDSPNSSSLSQQISLWVGESEDYIHSGNPLPDHIMMTNGTGISGDFGFIDAGAFSIEQPSHFQYCEFEFIDTFSAPRIGTKVFLESSHGSIEGQVAMVEAEYMNTFSDTVIQTLDSGTFEGDSGGIWRTRASGKYLAMHTLGTESENGNGSLFSFSSYCQRVASKLGGRLGS